MEGGCGWSSGGKALLRRCYGARGIDGKNGKNTEIKIKAGQNRRQLRIGIVGGGLSGLATALALQKESKGEFEILVFERDRTFADRKQGYGMTLRETKAIRYLGLSQELRDLDYPSRSHYVFDSKGRILSYFGNTFRNRPWGKKLVDVEDRGDDKGVRICMENKVGVRVYDEFDCLIAADGINSKVRSLTIGDSLSYLSIFLTLGLSHLDHQLVRERGFHTVDGYKSRLFTMPYAPGLTMWQLSYVLEEEEAKLLSTSGPERILQKALEVTKEWHKPVEDLLVSTQLPTIWGTPLYDRSAIPQRGKKGRIAGSCITFVGDAAHPMSPFKGQGANQALQDGPDLAKYLKEILTKKRKISKLMKRYEIEMMHRTAPKVLSSRQAAQTLHSQNALSHDRAFHGVSKQLNEKFLDKLRDDGPRAGAEDLDASLRDFLSKFRLSNKISAVE
ncbi:hypothetical protein AAMO2058_000350200 [Amorphochlora amoebiformis]